MKRGYGRNINKRDEVSLRSSEGPTLRILVPALGREFMTPMHTRPNWTEHFLQPRYRKMLKVIFQPQIPDSRQTVILREL